MGIVNQDLSRIADEELGSEAVSKIEEAAREREDIDDDYKGNSVAEHLYQNMSDVLRYRDQIETL